ncbi:MFS transporter [Maricurvus nonylphenolicus]|uniref:spinster family MFS transporter n=1 Tax=Maricurvus nonylphenolicus TaxID=1008307 RepID=UPI0036F3DBC3
MSKIISVAETLSDPHTKVSSTSDNTDSTLDYQNPNYRYFVLGVLTFVYVLSFVDRQILNILGEYIIQDLQLSDGQFGALSGIAFAAIYVIAGIPVARLADIGVRRNVVAISLAVWSVMTALCGAAQNFWQLFLARAGVGIGESGGSPPSHSMISDIFPANQRATALSIYSLGVYGGVLIGYLAGGYLGAMFSWRVAFVVVGLPGVLIAIFLRLAVKEPPRGFSENQQKPHKDTSVPPFKKVLALLWSRSSFKHLALGCALHAFVTYGLGNFMPVFLGRVHQMPIEQIGLWLGLCSGLGGLAGTFAGGYLSDKLANRSGDLRWHLWVPLYSTVAAMPFYLATFLFIDNGLHAAMSWFLPAFIGGMYLGPCLSMTHGLVGLRMRAVSSAILFFVINLIGLGLGPFITGLTSDFLKPLYGDESIRYALACMVVVNAWCAVHYHLASKTLRSDLANAPQ